MANQVKVGDRIWIPGSGWAAIVKITNRTTWQYMLPGAGAPVNGSGDILATPDKNIHSTGEGGALDVYNSGH